MFPLTFNSPAPPGAEGAAADPVRVSALHRLVQILTGYSGMRFVPFYLHDKHGETPENTLRRWRTVLGLEEIHFLPEDINDPDERLALGRVAHESWHVLFSRPELIFDYPELIENTAFQALWWSVEDPRININGLARHPGARGWIDAAYERDYAVRDLAAERAYWEKEIPLHLQFNYALIYEWWAGEPDPRVTNERVRQALDRARAAIRRAYETSSAARSFQIVREEIWPIYCELVEEAHQKEQKKSGDGKRSSQKMQEMEKKQRPQRGDQVDKMSEADRQKAKEQLERLRQKMGQEGGKGQDESAKSKGEQKAPAEPEMTAEEKAKQRERLAKADEQDKQLTPDDHAHYKDYLNRIRRFIPVMRQQFMQVLKRKIRRRTVHDRRSGDLDDENMADLPSGKPDPFTQTVSANKALYRISLLIDTSGSMEGETRERAIEGAVLLMESLEKLPGVVYEIVAFDSEPRVLKAYHEQATPAVKAAVVKALKRGDGSTQSHVAVREAIQRIRMGRGEKMIIMVNDGDPDNNFDRHQYRAMVEAASDIDIHGVGLGEKAQLVLDLFPPGRGWWLKDVADFAKNLRSILQKKILG